MNRLKAAHVYHLQWGSEILQRVWLTLKLMTMSVFVGAIYDI